MTNETKHTPAPWVIKGQDIFGNEKNGYICTWSGRSADAHLIAAAPNLLKALEQIILWTEDGESASSVAGVMSNGQVVLKGSFISIILDAKSIVASATQREKYYREEG